MRQYILLPIWVTHWRTIVIYVWEWPPSAIIWICLVVVRRKWKRRVNRQWPVFLEDWWKYIDKISYDVIIHNILHKFKWRTKGKIRCGIASKWCVSTRERKFIQTSKYSDKGLNTQYTDCWIVTKKTQMKTTCSLHYISAVIQTMNNCQERQILWKSTLL